MPFRYSFPTFTAHNSFKIKEFEQLDEKACEQINADLKTLRNLQLSSKIEKGRLCGLLSYVISESGEKYEYSTQQLKEIQLYILEKKYRVRDPFILSAKEDLDAPKIAAIHEWLKTADTPRKSWHPGKFQSVTLKIQEETKHTPSDQPSPPCSL